MNNQPVKSKKSHYILAFVIGIGVIGFIILILGIATNWFRGSSPTDPNGGSPGTPAPAKCEDGATWSKDGLKPCKPCSKCPVDQVVDNLCTSTSNTKCKERLPTSCEEGKWSNDGIKPCKPCSKCQYGTNVPCNSKRDTICKSKPATPDQGGPTDIPASDFIEFGTGTRHLGTRKINAIDLTCSNKYTNICYTKGDSCPTVNELGMVFDKSNDSCIPTKCDVIPSKCENILKNGSSVSVFSVTAPNSVRPLIFKSTGGGWDYDMCHSDLCESKSNVGDGSLGKNPTQEEIDSWCIEQVIFKGGNPNNDDAKKVCNSSVALANYCQNTCCKVTKGEMLLPDIDYTLSPGPATPAGDKTTVYTPLNNIILSGAAWDFVPASCNQGSCLTSDGKLSDQVYRCPTKQASPSCNDCISQGKFFCYNDGKCYDHGDSNGDAACPYKSSCVATPSPSGKNACGCSSCDDLKCSSWRTCSDCISQGKFFCYNDGKCYDHGDSNGDAACPDKSSCVANPLGGCGCTSCDDKSCKTK